MGLLLDLDGNLTNYEVQILTSGIDGTIQLYRNTTTTLPDDPADLPDMPAVKTYPLTTHARTVSAAGPGFGGNADYFLDVAIPWSDLQSVGVNLTTTVTAWIATSSNSNTLNGDFACWDNSLGRPTLSGVTVGTTTLDPRVDSDGDGFTDATEIAAGTDPHDPKSHPSGTPDAMAYAGGGGCSSAGATAPWILGLVLLAVLSQLQRRGRSSPAAR